VIRYPATIEQVVDGDTVIAEIDLGLNVRMVQYVRLAGLNAPERCKAATRYVQERLLIRKVSLAINEKRPREKYGRILVTIWLGDVNFNEELIEAGHAVVYDGGKRP
jgi:micrococcal nuclease